MSVITEYEAKKVAALRENPGPRGRFDWDTRAFAPGLDVGAVRLTAMSEGFATPGHDHDMAGPMAEFMGMLLADLDALITNIDRVKPKPYDGYLIGFATGDPAEMDGPPDECVFGA